MKVNGIQCDACTKIYEMDIVRDPLPNDWFEIKKGNGRHMHFCSLHCLHEWVEKQMPVVEEVDPIVVSEKEYKSRFKEEHGHNFGKRDN